MIACCRELSRPVRIVSLVLVALVALAAFLIASPLGSARAAVTTVKVMPLGDSITGSPGCWRQLLTNLWNGQLSGSSVTSASYNGSLAAGGSTTFGFQGAGSATGVGVANCSAG